MLVSVPLLFLHVKKFLSPSEGKHTPAGPERVRQRGGGGGQIRVIEVIGREASAGTGGDRKTEAE